MNPITKNPNNPSSPVSLSGCVRNLRKISSSDITENPKKNYAITRIKIPRSLVSASSFPSASHFFSAARRPPHPTNTMPKRIRPSPTQ